MIHTLLYSLAATVVAKVDKDKATKGLTAVATAVANGEGRPVLRQAAKALAESLQASHGTAPQPAASAVPVVEWERIADAMRTIHSGPAPAGGGSPAPGTTTRPARPPRPVQRGTLSGAYDAINLGGFTFALMRSQGNTQLVVGQLGVPGNVGGLFSLTGMRQSAWIRLEDRGSRQLPVWVSLHDWDVDLMVGDGPTDAVLLRAVDGLASSS